MMGVEADENTAFCDQKKIVIEQLDMNLSEYENKRLKRSESSKAEE